MMAGLLERHIAAITGSGSGIGRAIALGYAREGAHVMTLDINGDTAAKTAAEIRAAGARARPFTRDAPERPACRKVADEIAREVGAVSILVNNAGIIRRNALTAEA